LNELAVLRTVRLDLVYAIYHLVGCLAAERVV
jgi:hypothetical protein